MPRMNDFRMRFRAPTARHRSRGPSVIAHFDHLESRAVPTGVSFTVVAQTGGSISMLSSDVSLNDSGQLALTATLANGKSAILAGNSSSGLATLAEGVGSYDTAMISNVGSVAARQRLPNAAFAIRSWNVAKPGTFTNVNVQMTGGSVANPSISDNGSSIAYFFRPSGTTTSVLMLNGAERAGPFAPGVALIKPAVDDLGNIVTRRGPAATDPLVLYPAAGGSITLAGSPIFSGIGGAPGISRDGRVVVFQGTLSDAGAATINAALPAGMAKLLGGPGIFASVAVGKARFIQRVAGVSGNQRLDPGEFGDDNGDGVIDTNKETDSGAVTEFDADSRVGITGKGDSFDLTFVGRTPEAARAVFVSHLSLDTVNRVRGFAAPLVRAGDTIPGLGFVAASFRLFDPINAKGQVAFAAIDSTGTRVAAVRASDPWLLHAKRSAGNFSAEAFAAEYRRVFRRPLSGPQQSGVAELLTRVQLDTAVRDLRWISYMFATVKRETGTFTPIEEQWTSKPIQLRDDRPAFTASSAPDYFNYWYSGVNGNGDKKSNDGYTYRGRGYVQLTGRSNYAALGAAIKADLVKLPAEALKSKTAYEIMSYGLRHGSFDGRRRTLSTFFTDVKTDYVNARQLVNKMDVAETVAAFAEAFEAVLARSAR